MRLLLKKRCTIEICVCLVAANINILILDFRLTFFNTLFLCEQLCCSHNKSNIVFLN